MKNGPLTKAHWKVLGFLLATHPIPQSSRQIMSGAKVRIQPATFERLIHEGYVAQVESYPTYHLKDKALTDDMRLEVERYIAYYGN